LNHSGSGAAYEVSHLQRLQEAGLLQAAVRDVPAKEKETCMGVEHYPTLCKHLQPIAEGTYSVGAFVCPWCEIDRLRLDRHNLTNEVTALKMLISDIDRVMYDWSPSDRFQIAKEHFMCQFDKVLEGFDYRPEVWPAMKTKYGCWDPTTGINYLEKTE
jgi:hypothetical protein